jgi:hypothetical protein
MRNAEVGMPNDDVPFIFEMNTLNALNTVLAGYRFTLFMMNPGVFSSSSFSRRGTCGDMRHKNYINSASSSVKTSAGMVK